MPRRHWGGAQPLKQACVAECGVGVRPSSAAAAARPTHAYALRARTLSCCSHCPACVADLVSPMSNHMRGARRHCDAYPAVASVECAPPAIALESTLICCGVGKVSSTQRTAALCSCWSSFRPSVCRPLRDDAHRMRKGGRDGFVAFDRRSRTCANVGRCGRSPRYGVVRPIVVGETFAPEQKYCKTQATRFHSVYMCCNLQHFFFRDGKPLGPSPHQK